MRLDRLLAAVLVLALVAVLGGCTQPRQEPGLFGRPRSTPAPVPSSSTSLQAPVNAELPVAADGTWVSNDGRSVVVRYAVHAVRRTRTATVLDWSITALSAAGISAQGAAIPVATNLGLVDLSGAVNVLLVDADHRRVYRPLTRVGHPSQCYCSALDAGDLELAIGETRLLQLVYPALPRTLRTVDVDIATIPPFWHVPVTARNQVPRPAGATDLNREVDIHPALANTVTFDQGPGTQQFIAFVEDVIVADTFTALRWTVQSITDGQGLLARPPVSRADPSGIYSGQSASGPDLVVAGRRVAARHVTYTRRGTPPSGELRCLCSDLAAVTGEESINQRRTIVTTYPPLPRGTETVAVSFPGLPTIDDLRVVAASDASVRLGPTTEGTPAATPRAPVKKGWDVDAWPLPLPAEPSSRNWDRTIDKLR